MSERKPYRYQGGGLVVTWDRQRCIHAEECVHGLPEVFDPQARPWIRPEAATAAAVAGVVRRCPTGALRYEPAGGHPGEEPAAANTITVGADGPLYLRGDLIVEGGAGVGREPRAALCRCGASRIKPYCDGTHAELPFRDPGELGDKPAPAAPAEPGPLEVRPVPGGPLLIAGPVELLSADGAGRQRVAKAALCRCGASGNKPFCDGSHSRIGFESG